MIRVSAPDVARGCPAPKASTSSTRRPPRTAWSAVHAPIVPAPTTTRSVTSTLQHAAEPGRRRPGEDGGTEHHVGEPDAEVADEDPAGGPGDPLEQRLADRGIR